MHGGLVGFHHAWGPGRVPQDNGDKVTDDGGKDGARGAGGWETQQHKEHRHVPQQKRERQGWHVFNNRRVRFSMVL